MRIAILGPGAIGGLLAALFDRNGFKVVCVDRKENISLLAKNGLKLESNFFGNVSAKPRFVSTLDDRPDVLFVTTKNPFLKSALESVPALLVKRAIIIPLLNGIEHVDFLKLKFEESVVAATIGCVEAYSRELGQVTHVSQNAPCATLFSGVNDWQKEKVKEIADALRQIGLEVAMMDNEKDVLWSKLVRLSALAATGAASGREFLEDYVKEAAAVAKADGASVSADAALEHLYRLPAGLKSSLERDLEAKRPSELDALVGAILRKGQRFGIALPTIQSTLNIIKKKYNV